MITETPRSTLPKTAHEMRAVLVERLLNPEAIDDDLLTSILAKVEGGERLSTDEIAAIRRVTYLDNVCDCDTDHRIQDVERIDGPDFVFSAV